MTAFVSPPLFHPMQVEFGGRALYDCGGASIPDPSENCPAVVDAQSALKMGVDPDGAPWEAGVMIAYLIALRVMVYVALRVRTQAGSSGPRR
jgi:hypothetical protein